MSIEGFWIEIIAPKFLFLEFTSDPFPPGTNVYGNISLSTVDTLFAANDPDPKFAAEAFIVSWTFYQADGSESAPQTPDLFWQNAIGVNNCARITFALAGERVAALAQINLFTI